MLVLLIILVIINIVVVILLRKKQPQKPKVETPTIVKTKPVAISTGSVLYWRTQINNCEKNKLPNITDDFGNRYVIFGISPKGITLFEADPGSWDKDKKAQFNLEEIVNRFSSVFEFEYAQSEKIVSIRESEYLKLKEIEALHTKGLEEINEMFDPDLLKQLS